MMIHQRSTYQRAQNQQTYHSEEEIVTNSSDYISIPNPLLPVSEYQALVAASSGRLVTKDDALSEMLFLSEVHTTEEF